MISFAYKVRMLWRSVRQYKMGLRETFKVYCNHMNKHAVFLASPFIKIGTWGSSFVEATFQLNTMLWQGQFSAY